MKFKQGSRRKAAEYEKDLVQQWKNNKTFEKSVAQRPETDAYVFYDGPPFITGVPHHGTLLISTIKDAVARYQTMRGKRVERRWGWDCHGLPAEVYVEKKLGIANRSEIGTKISVGEYVNACRTAMEQGGTEWEHVIDRIGRWVEFAGAYKTMDKQYMESIWWAFKTLYEKGKIYEGEKVLLYCTRDATPISKSEVAMENSYKEVTDPSLYVYFKLAGQEQYLLAWTTTPWTLPANVALAVNPELVYAIVEYQGKRLIVAKSLVEKAFQNEKHQPLEYSIVGEINGSELVGKKYEPLFENHGPTAHQILAGDFVTDADGTGVVHIAPAYGEDDFNLSQTDHLPVVHVVDENGNYSHGAWLTQNIWETNKEIAKTMVADGRALRVDYIKHDYPHCHRCGTKLMYRAHASWFMDIQDQKAAMLAATEQTTWVPRALKDKRFKNVIASAPDWNLSRDRFWATPIPVWKGRTAAGEEVVKAFGSYEEFEQFTGLALDDYHLPMIMDIEFELDGVTMRHIGKVIDCWFESGSMPFAQFHYPFENKEKFESSFPADFIVEGVDQTRGWFYSLTAVNVALFGKAPYKNLICTGFINAADGQKISKKLKNYTDPNELMDKTSVDAFRLFLLSSPLVAGEDANLSDKGVVDVARKLAMVWNMYDFFTTYAEVDGWEWGAAGVIENPIGNGESVNPLDNWIVSRLHETMVEVARCMDIYELQNATQPLLPFLDDASNWYVRRSRRRFWKSGDNADKQAAYQTLHYILVQFAITVAPFTPFLAEELFRKLTGGQLGESVHLLDWPKVGYINEQLLDDMKELRELINQGLSQRAAAGRKVRQPLSSATLQPKKAFQNNFVESFIEIVKEELNVKTVTIADGDLDVTTDEGAAEMRILIDLELTDVLRREGLMREVIRYVQSARKQAGLNVDDHISLHLVSDDQELAQAMVEHSAVIAVETLADKVSFETIQSETAPLFSSDVAFETRQLTITITKKL